MNEPVQQGIAFRPEEYKEAAEEHILTAHDLWNSGAYVLGIYVAGVAVEAMFRGFFAQRSREFDSRHDLEEWSKKSGFVDLIPHDRYEEYSLSLSSMVLYWANNHRYRSQTSLKNYYKRLKRDRKIKGDVLKEIGRRTLSAAAYLITLGVLKWEN